MSLLQQSRNDAPVLQPAPRVLIADDDPAIRRLLGSLAKRERIEFDVACNGAEAVIALAQRPYSLLFLDIMMPRVDGRGVLDHLRLNARDVRPSIFVITACLDQPLSSADRDLVNGILYKPVDADDIAALLRAWTRGGSPAVMHRTRHRMISPA